MLVIGKCRAERLKKAKRFLMRSSEKYKKELGIKIQSSEELMLSEHDYPHAYVRLHVSII